MITSASIFHSDRPRKDSIAIGFVCGPRGLPKEFEIWLRGRGAIDGNGSDHTFHLSSDNFLSGFDDFTYLRDRCGAFPVEYDDFSSELMTGYKRDRELVAQLRSDVSLRLSESDVVQGLKEAGFLRWNSQTSDQIRDIGRLALLPNGANFSVPGAGKTNALLAVNALERNKTPKLKLLIVCPKNAMVSWDDEVAECLGPGSKVTRLEGGRTSIARTLSKSPEISVISYQQVRGVVELLIEFMSREQIHLVLDESHRIKAGQSSLQGAASLALAPHAVRRDILSGTPMPQGLPDLEAQFSFLWPALPVFKDIPPQASAQEQVKLANRLIRPLYVRTTKRELGLSKPHLHPRAIEMSNSQAATYELLKSESARFFAQLDVKDKDQLRKVGKQVMRVLQFCSNPELLRHSLQANDQYGELYSRLSELSSQQTTKAEVLDKLVRRILKKPGEKVVIWSMFVDQIERMVQSFREFGAISIHGGVPTGPDTSLDFREGRIKHFKTEQHCRVLVANPAACGEGISLHKSAHNAIYFDRSFNAAHFLQSIDRIHRRGLPEGVETNIYILYLAGTLEETVQTRLSKKIKSLQSLLDDQDLAAMVFDPEDVEAFGEDSVIEVSDLKAVTEAMQR